MMISQRFAVSVAAMFALACAPLAAHDTASAGSIRIAIGWGEEPAFSGLRNAVEVDLTDAQGAPVQVLNGSLSAEVSFGDRRVTLALRPVPQAPGRFTAWLVPTRPGTYSFHITGTVNGQAIDVTSTCSETTFDCVADVADVQFPARDPSPGQLAERVNRTLPRAERAIETAGRARTAGYAALTIAALALVAAFAFNVRRTR
jgi:hypothetical protein